VYYIIVGVVFCSATMETNCGTVWCKRTCMEHVRIFWVT